MGVLGVMLSKQKAKAPVPGAFCFSLLFSFLFFSSIVDNRTELIGTWQVS
jgi:hypothetical protein